MSFCLRYRGDGVQSRTGEIDGLLSEKNDSLSIKEPDRANGVLQILLVVSRSNYGLHSTQDSLAGSDSHVSALGLAPENIDVVNARVEAEQIACPVETRVGNVTSLSYNDDTFDAAWCANTTEYLTDEVLGNTLSEFHRVVNPGGLVAIKEFDLTGVQFYPFGPIQIWHLFELRSQGKIQARGVLRTMGLPRWFREAGLMGIRYKTMVGERRAPLRPVEREFIGGALQFNASEAERLGMPEPELSAWLQLLDIDSLNRLIDHPDFYWRDCHGVVTGRVPKP